MADFITYMTTVLISLKFIYQTINNDDSNKKKNN